MLHRLLCQAFNEVMAGARGAEVMSATRGRFRPLWNGRLALTVLLGWFVLIASMAGNGTAHSTLVDRPSCRCRPARTTEGEEYATCRTAPRPQPPRARYSFYSPGDTRTHLSYTPCDAHTP